jgi:hypothetical protein
MTHEADLRSAMVAKAKQLGDPAMTVKARCLMRGYDLPRWRANEAALERSRFVVLAAVTAAELAHRITYAWPR